jgi:anti-sigma factor RsiW
MRCEDADALIDAFVEAALEAPERRALEEHVGACARCGRALAASRRLSAALAALPASSPSAAADARARAAVDEEIAWARWRTRTRRVVAGLAAAAAVVVVAFAAFVAAPAAASVGSSVAAMLRMSETWLRLHAAPTLFELRWTLVAGFVLFVVVAALDRTMSRAESAARPAR